MPSDSPHQRFHSREQATAWLTKHAVLSERVRAALRYALLSPEETRVLRSAVAEYRAGHRSDLAAAKDPATTYTSEDRAEYQRALQEHYTAVRALIRATSQQAKETPHHAVQP